MIPPSDGPKAFPLKSTLTGRSASRRAALVGGAAVGAAVLVPGAASAATAKPKASTRAITRRAHQGARGTFAVPNQHIDSLPDAWTRHMLSRFSGGASTKRLAEVEAAGGPDAWFEAQLTPNSVPDPDGDALWSWFPILAMTPGKRYTLYKGGGKAGWLQMQDLANWIMLRRLISSRALQEMMVDFWSNLMHVASPAADCWPYRVEYEETVRANAFGKFSAILPALALHPAMTLYLQNDQSRAAAVNENLGRELLECHTVGVGNYTQDDVADSARILSGFKVDVKKTWLQTYIPKNHYVGRVQVMSFSSPNSTGEGGPDVLAQYFDYLAHHALTAERICRRLAVRFVSDLPSEALVASLTQVYQDSDTAIVPVLRALVASDEFKTSAFGKVRTPSEDAVATWAALGVVVAKPKLVTDAANQFINVSKGIGQVVYDWPTPDAFPDLGGAWTDSGRMLGSMRAHWLASMSVAPSTGITYKKPMDWMPQLPAMFDDIVDYVVRAVLNIECTPTMLQAACAATEIKPNDYIQSTHALIKYKFPRLMASILDTPTHLSR